MLIVNLFYVIKKESILFIKRLLIWEWLIVMKKQLERYWMWVGIRVYFHELEINKNVIITYHIFYLSILFTFKVNLDFSLSTLFLCTRPLDLALSKLLIANLKLFSAASLLPAKTALSVFFIAFLTILK